MTDAVSNMWTNVLLAIGGLITALCGSCTAFFFIAGLVDGGEYGGAFLFASLIIGGLPTAVGGLLLWWGLRRRARAKAAVAKGKVDIF